MSNKDLQALRVFVCISERKTTYPSKVVHPLCRIQSLFYYLNVVKFEVSYVTISRIVSILYSMCVLLYECWFFYTLPLVAFYMFIFALFSPLSRKINWTIMTMNVLKIPHAFQHCLKCRFQPRSWRIKMV